MFKTNQVDLSELLNDIHKGKIQLPDFQRGWVWDDERIKNLLVSISRSFPVGAIMTLSADGDIQFQKRPIEGVTLNGSANHEFYLLDGQQRLTSLFQALLYEGPVETRDRPGGEKVIKRWYYIDMEKALDPLSDPEEAFISVPEGRVERKNFGRNIVHNLSSQDLEFENHKMPTEQIMDSYAWGYAYAEYWKAPGRNHPHGNPYEFFMEFQKTVLKNFTSYELPVINLEKDTSKEAVCTVFEKVNTGGVTLTVFELLTASFAVESYSLRDDWNVRRKRMYSKFNVLRGVDGTNFLQVVALLVTQQRRKQAIGEQPLPSIGCKRNDILSLSLDEYREWAGRVEAGLEAAARFLHGQYVFTQKNIPYNTQIVALAALYVELGKELEAANSQSRLEHWYWAGVFGEMYGSTVETQYARDMSEVANYVRSGIESTLIREANFDPNRLITLRSRQSAAYKGLYVLQMKSGATDWRTGNSLALDTSHDQRVDIHHIFPRRWCEKESSPPIPAWSFNSIINKTPIDARTNRIVGGNAPSRYLPRLREQNSRLNDVLSTHWLNHEHLEHDNFADFFVERGEAMLELIGRAMGKPISGGRETFLDVLRSEGIVDTPQEAELMAIESLVEELEDDNELDELGEADYQV